MSSIISKGCSLLSRMGRIYYEQAKNILAEVNKAEAMVAENNIVPRGQIKVTTPTTFGIHTLAYSFA